MGEISENALHGIIAGLQLAGQRKARVQQAQLEREKLAQESEIEQKRREARAQEHQDIVTHQNAQLDLARATHKVMALKERNDILKGHVESGYPLLPGSGMSSVGTEGGMETIRQQDEPGVAQPAPGFPAGYPTPYSDIQVPTQQEFAHRAAQSLMELNKPKEELAHSKAMDLLDRQLQVEEAKATNAQAKAESLEDYKAAREKENITLRNQGSANVARINSASRLAAAALRLKTGAQVEPQAVANDVAQVNDGLVTLNELRKLAPSKEHLAAVLSATNAAGIRPLDEKQKPLLDAFTPAFSALHLYDQWLDDLKAHPAAGRAGIMGVGTEANQNLYNLSNAISENLGTFQSLMIKTGRGVTDKRIQQVKDAYTPSLGQGMKANLDKVKRYKDLLNELFTSSFSNLAPEQQNAIRNRLSGIVPEVVAPQIVIMKSPDGQSHEVHPEDVTKAKSKGWK